MQHRPEFHLKVVKEISEITNRPGGIGKILQQTADHLAESMQFDVVSIYLWDGSRLVLKASHGLHFDPGFPITLAPEEGLTGLVYQQRKTVNIAPASSHPRYKYFPDSGEWAYESYLGAPVLLREKCLGVLVAQYHEEKEFHPSCATLFEIIAGRLAGLLEVAGRIESLAEHGVETAGEAFRQGMGVSTGIAHGRVVVLRGMLQEVNTEALSHEALPEEQERLEKALARVDQEMQALLRYLQSDGKLSPGEIAIFRAQLLLLGDPAIRSALSGALEKEKRSAEYAVTRAIDEIMEVYGSQAPEFFKERLNDVRDLGEKLMIALLEDRGQVLEQLQPPPGSVIVAHEIGPARILALTESKPAGVVTEVGGEAGHMAVVARSLGIPAVTGVEKVEDLVHTGDELLVDGRTGFIFLNPSESLVREYDAYRHQQQEIKARLREEGKDLSGAKLGVRVTANIGFPGDIVAAQKAGVTDVGLFRTEFGFMQRSEWPDEEEQVRMYEAVAKEFEGYITVRTLDIGSDKQLPYHVMPREENPMLGMRSIRFSLENLELFETQILAVIRTMQMGFPMRILLPMITQTWEISAAKDIIESACNELGLHRNERPALGMMLEVPGVIYQMEDFMEMVDFVSLGTNDLIQYLLSVDRNSQQVGHMYCEYHPIVVRFLHEVIQHVTELEKDITVCGEMAGNPMGLLILLALGYRKFSVTPERSYVVRYICRHIQPEHLVSLREKILQESSVQNMRLLLNDELSRIDKSLLEID